MAPLSIYQCTYLQQTLKRIDKLLIFNKEYNILIPGRDRIYVIDDHSKSGTKNLPSHRTYENEADRRY